MEQEEKSLYGFDLSNYIQNKDVQDAESVWITPNSISNLVNSFFTDFLGDGEYVRANKVNELRTLTISGDKKKILKDDLKKINLVNSNNATRHWKAYLDSSAPKIRITYDAETAKDNRNAEFLTQMHPLVLQAARHESEILPCEIGISVSDDSIQAGDYEFRIYAWKYVGLRPDIKLIAVSDNDAVSENLLNIMQYASDFTFDDSQHLAGWDSMDKIHYENWQAAKTEYIDHVKDDCNFRVEQLRQTTTKRENILKAQIASATDERILRMRKSQLDNLRKKYEEQKKVMEEIILKADIHTQPLVKGLLHVE